MNFKIKWMSLIIVTSALACNKKSSDDGDDTSDKKTTASGTLVLGNLNETQVATLTDSPPLEIELNQKAAVPGIVQASASFAPGDLSEGGCLAWATRKDAKITLSNMEFQKCILSKAGDDEKLTSADGTYLQTHDDRVTKVRIRPQGDGVKVHVCLPGYEQENMRISISKSEEKGEDFIITGVELYIGDTFKRYSQASIKSTTEKITTSGFQTYWDNGRDADLCQGLSGTSADENDDTCFRRLMAHVINDESINEPTTTLEGHFVEKNTSGVRGGSAVYSKFVGGVGASLIVHSIDQATQTFQTAKPVESWRPQDFTITEEADFAEEVASATIQKYSLDIPAINDKWDCDVGDNAVTFDIDDVNGHQECFPDQIIAPDFTNCTGGDNELAEQINGFLCDDNDPLTSSDGVQCN